MIRRQLELGFENRPGIRPANRRGTRSARAHWWFEQMHEVVNEARDWVPAPPLERDRHPVVATRAKAERPPAKTAPPAPGQAPTTARPPSRHVAGGPRWKFAPSRRLLWE
jgi:hypothetical protein